MVEIERQRAMTEIGPLFDLIPGGPDAVVRLTPFLTPVPALAPEELRIELPPLLVPVLKPVPEGFGIELPPLLVPVLKPVPEGFGIELPPLLVSVLKPVPEGFGIELPPLLVSVPASEELEIEPSPLQVSVPKPVLEGFEDELRSLPDPDPVLGLDPESPLTNEFGDGLPPQFLPQRNSRSSCLHFLLLLRRSSRTNRLLLFLFWRSLRTGCLHFLFLFWRSSWTGCLHFLFLSVRGARTHFLNLLCIRGSAADLQGPAAHLHSLAECGSSFSTALPSSTAGFLFTVLQTACSEGPQHVWAGLLTSVVGGMKSGFEPEDLRDLGG
ncbi:hypothetical protein CRENBAI_023106 [Crenichthys baileyi]|uniref:Uncharacterized protein n=1 Tax=Crenichthys baileyi TaxID=28760 RepID=A0AAV9R2U9_9TELE